jgi:mRNA interferase RelE/StbE
VIYAVQIKESVLKALAKLPKADRIRADQRISALVNNPRPIGCVKLSGHPGLWRIRVGDWRIVYQIQDEQLIVLVLNVGHRREVYRGM